MNETPVNSTAPIAINTGTAAWRKSFRRLSELDEGEVPMLIENILPAEGVTFLGSLSGVGKTWVALSMAKALRTGKPLFGRFRVPTTVPVAYLVPEMGSRAVRNRAAKLGIPDSEQCLMRTLKEGVMRLDSADLKAMIRELKPVLFLDTAIRFTAGAEENSASQNAVGLADSIFTLLRLGARAVTCLHHSPKASGKAPCMTLENVLRGTGDFGAMCEVVWGIERARHKNGKGWDREYEKESADLTRLSVECLKGRDIPDVADPFIIQGRPHIDERGDFAVIRAGELDIEAQGLSTRQRLDLVIERIQSEPKVSLRTLSKLTGWNTAKVKMHAASEGWQWTSGDGWQRGTPEPVPDLSDLESPE